MNILLPVIIIGLYHAYTIAGNETPADQIFGEIEKLKKTLTDISTRLDRHEQDIKNKISEESLKEVIRKVLEEEVNSQNIPIFDVIQNPDSRVAFHVQKSHTQVGPGPASFENVITQMGGIWNSVAHNFLVPIKGMYFIHLTAMSGTTGNVVVHIRRDLDVIQAAYARGEFDSGSSAIITELDEVTQLSAYITRGTLYGGDSDGNFSHFTGFMLYAMR